MKFVTCLPILVALLLIGCKAKKSETTPPETTPTEEQSPNSSNSGVVSDKSEIPPIDPELDYSEMAELAVPKDSTIESYLSTELWEYTKGIIGTASAQNIQGKWIKFNEDYSFIGGFWEEQTVQGEWSYSSEGKLHLIPFNAVEKESEWRLRRKDNSMVISGTERFGDQSTQIFLARRNSRPRQIF